MGSRSSSSNVRLIWRMLVVESVCHMELVVKVMVCFEQKHLLFLCTIR